MHVGAVQVWMICVCVCVYVCDYDMCCLGGVRRRRLLLPFACTQPPHPTPSRPVLPQIPLRRVKSGRITQAEAVARMLEYDQLGIEKAKGRVFAGLEEPPVGFLPTFKVGV